MKKNVLAFVWLCLLCTASVVQAQTTNTWESFSSHKAVRFIEKDVNGTIWTVTEGGMFSLQDGEVDGIYTRSEGLYRLNPSAFIYDQTSGKIWIGYEDGMLESFDPQTELFQQENAIFRATQYVRRNIANIRIHDNLFYIATGFGVVVYDPVRRLVRETYANLGSFPSGTSVHDVTKGNGFVYAATDLGLAIGNEDGADLVNPANWQNETHVHEGARSIQSAFYFRDRVYLSMGFGNYMYRDGVWEQIHSYAWGGIKRYRPSGSGNALVAISENYVRWVDREGGTHTVTVPDGMVPGDVYLDDSGTNPVVYLGTDLNGLTIAGSGGNSLSPVGPDLNLFTGMKMINGVFISGTSINPGRRGTGPRNTGFTMYQDGVWTNVHMDNNADMAAINANSYYVSAGNEQYYFFGSWGSGLVGYSVSDKKTTLYTPSVGAPINPSVSPTFTIVPGMDMDQEGKLWFTVHLANPNVLYRFDPTSGTFQGFPRNSIVTFSDHYYHLMVDSFGQKWIALMDAALNGRGLMVLDQRALENTADDEAVVLNQSVNNLPHNKVNAIVQDRRGEVWVGTEEGIARFLFPDRVVHGGSPDRQAERLRVRNAVTGAVTFFLSRTAVNTIAVNAANEKWIGTQGDGVYHVREDGGMITVLKHFTPANSPLPSENITSVTVDDLTGSVYIATESGMLRYSDVVKAGERDMKALKVYPNPFVYDRADSDIVIEGLSAGTRIHILSVDGRLVRRLDVRGGRGSWDALDSNGQKLPSGVYTVIAVDEDGSQKGTGKVVVVR